jgi:hypothetical protein
MSRKQYSRYVLVVDNLSSSTPSSGECPRCEQQQQQHL